MIDRMKSAFWGIVVFGFFGMAACHDTHLATDDNALLLTNPTNSATLPVRMQGTVTCDGCEAGTGMIVIVNSALGGAVANGLFDAVGAYSLAGTARSGEVINLRVTVHKSSGPVSKTVSVTVPNDGSPITQDIRF
jgi:hypothetical protein